MPTFTDPTKDAAEASEALRGLTHATIRIDQPTQMYPILGDLLSGVRSLRQALDQLAEAHATRQVHATDDHGNPAAGARDALAAADELHQAATLIDAAHDRLDAAMAAAGRIAWHPSTTRSVRQWVNIVFLQGEEADRVIDLISRDGPAAGIGHLKQWDYGDETTDAALENGYIYDTPPVGDLDRSVTDGDYALTYNPFHGHVSLHRAHNVPLEPDDTLATAPIIGPAVAAGGPARAVAGAGPSSAQGVAVKKDWFANTTRSTHTSGRGLGL
ncbi:hypothetical protein [Janibacter sp. G1551]|uniref:hypothetical protein n=1 Tax=Janibacter sp. G1551 TaxID=3420440 RepID=UPI003D09508D